MITKHQYRTLVNMQFDMTRAGWHPAIAGKLLTKAANRVLRRREIGLGKVHQTRRIRREEPGIPPRPVVAGEQCQRIQEIPGREEEIYSRLNELRSRGFNVMEMPVAHGFPKTKVYWACPAGQMPREAQAQMFQAQPWGSPLYV